MKDQLSEEEQRELQNLFAEFADAGQDDDGSDSDTDSDDDEDSDEANEQGNLRGFVVNDDEEVDSEPESEGADAIKDENAEAETQEGVAGPSKKQISKGKGKAKQAKKAKPAKKGKGKKEKQPKKKKKSAMTLAELKKLSTRSKSARKTYMRRIREDWMSSAKIDKTMELLREIMNNPEGEKVLVFSQWTSLLDLLEVPIDQEAWGYRRYDGRENAYCDTDMARHSLT